MQLPKQAWPELFAMMNGLVRSWPDAGTHPAETWTRQEPWDEAANAAMLEYFIENALDEDQIRNSIQLNSTNCEYGDRQLQPHNLPGRFRSSRYRLGFGRSFKHGANRNIVGHGRPDSLHGFHIEDPHPGVKLVPGGLAVEFARYTRVGAHKKHDA